MLDLKFVASIAERDIDLLLLEELSASDEFREWFTSRIFAEPVFQNSIGAWHSVSGAELGESDLIFLFEASGGSRKAILIENKIDAPPQQEQGQRYHQRGERGLKDGYWEEFKTCVIAPSRYLSSSKHTEAYNVEISYEELLAYFQSRSVRDDRFSYKARVLLEGIEQNRRGYQPKFSEEMTRFVENYYAFVMAKFPQLGMQKPKPRPAGSTWVMFYPKSLPDEVSLVHQLKAGFAKAIFAGQADMIDTIKSRYEARLPDDATIDVAGKSAAISIEVPELDALTVLFADQQVKVEQALKSIVLLEKLFSED